MCNFIILKIMPFIKPKPECFLHIFLVFFSQILPIFLTFFYISHFALSADADDEDFFTEMEQELPKQPSTNNDPFEKFNRKIFNFNTAFYDKLLVPAGDWYENTIPQDVRIAIKNVLQNYSTTPSNIFFSVADFDLEAVIVGGWRFFTNTLFGFFGIDDIATKLDLEQRRKSLDNILYFYHIPRGPYIMLPLIGPSNLRDITGTAIGWILTSYFTMHWLIGDYAYLYSYANYFNPAIIPFDGGLNAMSWISFSMTALNLVRISLEKNTTIKFLSANTIDRYTNFRSAYYQSLNKTEKEYKEARFNGKTTRYNVCDYDTLDDLPDSCKEDPKSYSLAIGGSK